MKKDYGKMSKVELEGEKRSAILMTQGIGAIGTVAGWIYANRTGGGFWRYVGFGFLGGAAIGTIAYFTTAQKLNKIQTAIDKKE